MKPTIVLFAYGGVEPDTHGCMINEMNTAITRQVPVLFQASYGDADIGRCRSIIATKFLNANSDVLVMVDHDVTWCPGDLIYLAEKALEKNAVVGAIVSKKGIGLGFNSQLDNAADYNPEHMGTDVEYKSSKIATAICAFPRTVVQAVADSVGRLATGWFPVFIPGIFNGEYLSEDYAFCMRAKDLGFECYLSTKPIVSHVGSFAFTPRTAMMKNEAVHDA